MHPRTASILFDEDGAASYTTIGDLAEIDAPELSLGRMPDTILGDTIISTEPGWFRVGDGTFKVKIHQTQYDVLVDYFTAKTTLFFRIVLPTITGQSAGAQWNWSGYFGSVKLIETMTVESDEPLMTTFVIVPKTYPTWTAGA